MIGSTSGVGKELANNLYAHNAKVYLAARSASKADETIRPLKSNFPSSNGVAVFLKLDLNDLNTIKVSAEEFLNKEQRLDVLWNNVIPPQGSQTKRKYELQCHLVHDSTMTPNEHETEYRQHTGLGPYSTRCHNVNECTTLILLGLCALRD